MSEIDQKPKHKRLTSRQVTFVSAMISGLNQTDAARSAGCKGNASVAAVRWMQMPQVKAALERERASARLKSEYGYNQAMQEANDAIEFAKKTENATAYATLVQHRAKLSGLLVDKQHLQIETVDISEARRLARERIEAREVKTIEATDHTDANDRSPVRTSSVEILVPDSDKHSDSET